MLFCLTYCYEYVIITSSRDTENTKARYIIMTMTSIVDEKLFMIWRHISNLTGNDNKADNYIKPLSQYLRSKEVTGEFIDALLVIDSREIARDLITNHDNTIIVSPLRENSMRKFLPRINRRGDRLACMKKSALPSHALYRSPSTGQL